MEGQIPEPVKKARSQMLMEAGEQACQRFLEQNRGKVRKVLLEEYKEEQRALTGYTDNYIRVYLPAEEGQDSELDGLINNFRDVRLVEPFLDGMKGEFLVY